MKYIVANLIFWPIWTFISAIPYLLIERAKTKAGIFRKHDVVYRDQNYLEQY